MYRSRLAPTALYTLIDDRLVDLLRSQLYSCQIGAIVPFKLEVRNDVIGFHAVSVFTSSYSGQKRIALVVDRLACLPVKITSVRSALTFG